MLETLISLDTQLTLWFNGSDSLFLDTFAMTATKTSTWVPLAVLLFYVLVRMKNWKHYFGRPNGEWHFQAPCWPPSPHS